MGNEPIVSGAFGWGRTFRLYSDHLDAGGVSYDLTTLTHIHPSYRKVMGIPSARLELTFGRERLILRGIAAVENARKMVAYLTERCPETPLPVPPTGWQRTREPEDEKRQEHAQASSAPTSLPSTSAGQELRLRRLHYPGTQRARYRSSWSKQVMRHFTRDDLPAITVPVRLPAGEYACYSTEATLCGECVVEPASATYPPRDRGLLILTNRRILYIGRKSQILLGYARLFHVSRLNGAVAFLADYWHKREIFVMRHPLECVMCLERILRQFEQEQQATPIQEAAYTEKHIADEQTCIVPILSQARPQRWEHAGEIRPRTTEDAEKVAATQKVARIGSHAVGERPGWRDA